MAPIVPPPGYSHSYTHYYLMRDFRTFCVYVFCFAFGANFLPPAKRLDRWPRAKAFYCFLIDVVALFACNWRMCLPSLQGEFMGFRKAVKKRVRKRIRSWTVERDEI